MARMFSHLAAGEAVGHVGVFEVIRTGRAAADVRLGQVAQFKAGNFRQNPTRRGGDALGVGKMAGVVIRGHCLDPAAGRNKAQVVQQFVHVFHLGGEFFAVRLQAVLPMPPVLL